MSLLVYGCLPARFQSLHYVINRYLSENLFDGRVDLLKYVSQNGFNIDANRTIRTRWLPVERKYPLAFKRLIYV
jgi:hypothetical protein